MFWCASISSTYFVYNARSEVFLTMSIFKRSQLILQSCFSLIFSDDTFLYISFLFGFHFDYKNKIATIISRFYCLCYSACILLHFLIWINARSHVPFFIFTYYFILDALVFLSIAHCLYRKQVHISKYLKGVKATFGTLKLSPSQMSFSYSALLIQILAISKAILMYHLFIKLKILPSYLHTVFSIMMIDSSSHIPCISIVFVYDLLWKQLKMLREILQYQLIQQNSNFKNKISIVKKFICIYKNIILNMDKVKKHIGTQVRILIN